MCNWEPRIDPAGIVLPSRCCFDFGATVCKTVGPTPSDRCPVCLSCLSVRLSVCDVGVLWPNSWMHQDES